MHTTNTELRSASFASFGWAMPFPDNENSNISDPKSASKLNEPETGYVMDDPAVETQDIPLDQVYLALEQLYLDIEANEPESE